MKNISLIMLSVVLLSCSNASNEAVNHKPEVSESISVSLSQFNTNQMTLATPKITSFSSKIKVNGKVDVPAKYRAAISAYYPGYVKDIEIIEGMYVKKGQKLFTLQNPEYIQMQQEYLESKAQLGYLKNEYDRQKVLANENIASKKNHLKAKSEYEITYTKYKALKKKLSLMGIQAAALSSENIRSVVSIYAPISGFVSQITISQGKILSPNETALTIINTEHLHIEMMVFQKDILNVKKGQKVIYSYAGNMKKAEGFVYLIGRTIQEGNNAIGVHGHIDKMDDLLHLFPGMFVEADIITQAAKKLGIPENCVVELNGKYYVLKLDEKSEKGYVFKQEEVNVLSRSNGFVHIAQLNEQIHFLSKGAFDLILE